MYPLKLSTQKWTISNAMKSCLLEIKSCLLGIKSCLWILNRSAETLLENERETGLLQIDHNARGRAGWKGLAIVGKTRRRRGHVCAIIQPCWAIFCQWTRQGSLLFSKFEFSVKPDLRDLSFSYGGLRQFFIKCRQFAIKVRILCIYEV